MPTQARAGMQGGPQLAMVAGEPSGDLIAGLVLAELAKQVPHARFFGIGGPCMHAQGFAIQTPMAALSVHGFMDALIHYREIWRIRDRFARELIQAPPDLFIGTDAPDFNLGLERQLKHAGVPTVHIVSPSIWAWRGGRIHSIKQAVDLMLCLFPFEPDLYRSVGVKAIYVGHPLADVIPMNPDPHAARLRLGLREERQWLAVLPGSREGEMRRIGPAFVGAAVKLALEDPGLGFLVPIAAEALRAQFEEILAVVDTNEVLRERLVISAGQSHDVIEASDAVLVASGTATLECALFKKPMVIGYRVGAINYLLMKRMAYLPWIGLPNILLRDYVVPELVQDECEPEALSQAVRKAIDDQPLRHQLTEQFTRLHETLKCNTATRAAEAILELLGSRSGACS